MAAFTHQKLSVHVQQGPYLFVFVVGHFRMTDETERKIRFGRAGGGHDIVKVAAVHDFGLALGFTQYGRFRRVMAFDQRPQQPGAVVGEGQVIKHAGGHHDGQSQEDRTDDIGQQGMVGFSFFN
jgi:hypothetical protein